MLSVIDTSGRYEAVGTDTPPAIRSVEASVTSPVPAPETERGRPAGTIFEASNDVVAVPPSESGSVNSSACAAPFQVRPKSASVAFAAITPLVLPVSRASVSRSWTEPNFHAPASSRRPSMKPPIVPARS